MRQRFEITDRHLFLIRDYPHLLGHAAGKTRLTPLHSQWIRYLWDVNEDRAIQAHRGSYKTTAMAVGVVRWMLFHPDDRIAIIRKTFSDAAEIVAMVYQMMEMPEIREIFRHAHGHYPRARVKREGVLRYNFKYTASPEGNVTAHGLDGSLTGKHYDKIWTDDIITLKDRISRAERERTKELIREIFTNIIDPGKSVMSTGTPWHREDGWNAIPCAPLKFPVSACGLLSPEDIERKRKTTTPFLYAANYDLELTTDESAMFKDPHYGQWDFFAPRVVGHLDAAFDGDHYNALTFMARIKDRIQGIGWVYPGNVKDWLPEIARLCKTYRVKLLHNETNPDKGYTADALAGLGVPVHRYSESANKHIKIATHLFSAWEDIDWAPETEDEYMSQVLDYREGMEPDDAPDSAATLIRAEFPAVHIDSTKAWSM